MYLFIGVHMSQTCISHKHTSLTSIYLLLTRNYGMKRQVVVAGFPPSTNTAYEYESYDCALLLPDRVRCIRSLMAYFTRPFSTHALRLFWAAGEPLFRGVWRRPLPDHLERTRPGLFERSCAGRRIG